MKKLFGAALVAASVVYAGAAFANSTMDATYGNTVTVTYADGSEVHFYMNEDGSYSMATADGTLNGTWAIDGENICLHPEGGEASCSPLVEGMGVGDSWTGEGADGSEIMLTITEGR